MDLPGLIHSESKSLTAQDVELVTELVKSYLKNPRSIILAMITAKNDILNQIILKRTLELGKSRLTLEEQRKYLLDISERFEKLCAEAINGPYSDPFFGDGVSANGYETRFRAVVKNKQMEFADIIRTDGQQWKILDSPSEVNSLSMENSSSKDNRYRTRAQAINKILALVKCSRCKELPGLPNPMLVAEFSANTASHGKNLLVSILMKSGRP